MFKFALKYGIIAGLISISAITIGLVLGGANSGASSQLLGYAIMLLALSVIYFAIRRYRDTVLGGVIRFGQAALLGIIISAIAGVAYVAAWEVYLAFSGTEFIDGYIAGTVEKKQAAGLSAAALEAEIEKLNGIKDNYAKPWIRLPMTFTEIFPVGLLVSLISAAILRTRAPAKD
ncbi:MAG: DUF4199 domain-containing protein [Paracoccaceae bacterium]